MKLKFIIAGLAVALLLPAAALAAGYPDTAADAELNEAVDMLNRLDVISGMSDGLYHPEQSLSRAQFAKIATYLMGREEDAVSTGVSFVDVPQGHWATGYIGLVSGDGVIAGYPDGTFGPDDQVTWAQAITIVVRTLGYGGEDVGYRWPEGYIEKARAVGLLDGLELGGSDAPITRGDAARLCYNALFTDMKTGGELVSLRKVTRLEDAVIIADNSEDPSLDADAFKTSAGSYKAGELTDSSELTLGSCGDLYVDSDGNIVAFIPDSEELRSLIVTSTLLNGNSNEVEISYTEDGVPGRESFALGLPLYNEGNPMTVGTGYQLMTEGSELLLYYNKGSLQRGLLKAVTMAGPVIAESESFSPEAAFGIRDVSSLKVIRKGLSASLADIERFDVLYYAENTNTLYAYADRVTGIYEKAHPIKANVTSITLSGTVYQLATQEAINKLNESPGAFAINDRVTLLKGRNGEIVGAVDTDSADLYGYGVIQNAYTRLSEDEDSEGRSDFWVTVFMADGTAADYRCDADYTDHIGELRRLNFTGGVLNLEKIKYQVLTGSVDATSSRPTLAGRQFANDYGIIELVSLPEEGPAVLRKVSLNEMDLNKLSTADVIHVQTTGPMEDISILYLRGVTNEQYSYGVVKEYEAAAGSKTGNIRNYTILLGTTETVIANTSFTFAAGEAIGYGPLEDGKTGFISLTRIGGGKAVEARTSNRIKVDGVVYSLSDGAVAYGGDYSTNYRAMSLDELAGMEGVASVELYSDRALENGGAVKVIIVKMKR